MSPFNTRFNLGKFHIWLLGRSIEGYHDVLQVAQALFDIHRDKVRQFVERDVRFYDKKKEENKHLVKNLALKYHRANTVMLYLDRRFFLLIY